MERQHRSSPWPSEEKATTVDQQFSVTQVTNDCISHPLFFPSAESKELNQIHELEQMNAAVVFPHSFHFTRNNRPITINL